MKKERLLVAIPVVAFLVIGLCYTLQEATAQSVTRRMKQAHYDDLWAWLKRTDYTQWSGPDGKAPDFQKGESPHGALIKTYVNARAATNLKDLANGSVIVKENFGPKKKLMAITVMHRSKRYDPAHGDWYYAKYMPDGRIAKTPPEMKSMPIAGRFNKCIECHSGAEGDDFAFFND